MKHVMGEGSYCTTNCLFLVSINCYCNKYHSILSRDVAYIYRDEQCMEDFKGILYIELKGENDAV